MATPDISINKLNFQEHVELTAQYLDADLSFQEINIGVERLALNPHAFKQEVITETEITVAKKTLKLAKMRANKKS